MNKNMNIIFISSLIGALLTTIIYLIISYYFCKKISIKPEQSLKDIIKIAKSGDMVLFCADNLAGRVIRFTSNDHYSHSAILFKEDNQWYIWDSDFYAQFDFISQRIKNGPKLRKLENAIKDYGICKAKLYPLKYNLVYKINNWKNKLKIYKNTCFEDNPVIWYLADWKLNLLNFKKRLFCSELIADTYQKFGIFNNNIPAHLYTFKDLRKQHNVFDKSIYFSLSSPT